MSGPHSPGWAIQFHAPRADAMVVGGTLRQRLKETHMLQGYLDLVSTGYLDKIGFGYLDHGIGWISSAIHVFRFGYLD